MKTKICTIVLLLFMINSLAVNGQNINRVEYYLDNDPGYGLGTEVTISAGTPINNLIFQVPISNNLADGFHRVHVRAKDVNNQWSMVVHHQFYKLTFNNQGLTPPNISRLEYYVDTDPGNGLATEVMINQGTPLNNVSINVPITNNFSDGLHRIHVRAKDVDNNWSVVAHHQFLKMTFNNPALVVPNVSRLEYYVDADPGFGLATEITIAAGPSISNIGINVPITNDLADGFHRVHVRAKDVNNKWSIIANHQFLKTTFSNPSSNAPNISRAEYFIDTDPGVGNGIEMPLTPGTPINNLSAMINITNLALGSHKIYFRAKDVNNKWSLVGTRGISIENNALLIGNTPLSYCKNVPFNIVFGAYGTFNSGNVFTAHLLDNANNVLASLGTLTATSSGTISATIPNATALGDYKIRVSSSNPTIGVYPTIPFSVVAVCPPPCPSELTLVSTADDYATGTVLKQANAITGTITAKNDITGNAKVTYNAGKFIILDVDFKAENGTVFIAQIGGCN